MRKCLRNTYLHTSKAFAELENGNQLLGFVQMENFVDLQQLMREGETIEVFNMLAVDEILLRWVNEMIRANRVQQKESGKLFVHNFADDMKVPVLDRRLSK